jgi:hypothetical protein
MNSHLLYAGYFALALPYLAIAAILLRNKLRRMQWRHGKNRRPTRSSICTTSVALGAMLLLGQVFYRPSMAHVVQAREQIDVDEDDSGDPEHPDRALHRQLRQIRRGELVRDLILRL